MSAKLARCLLVNVATDFDVVGTPFMDISTIKAKSIEETATRPQGATRAENGLSALSASFKEFMKTGLGGGKGGKFLIDASQITATDNRAAPREPVREPVRETSYEDAPKRYDDNRDRLDETGRGERRDNDRFEARPPDRRDDYGRERADARGDAPSEAPSGLKAEAPGETRAPDERTGKSGRDSQTPENPGETVSNGDAVAIQGRSGGKTSADAAKVVDVLAASVLKKTPETAASKAPEDILSAQIAVVQTAALPVRSGERAKARQGETGGRENALNGLSKALEATSKGAAAQVGAQPGKQTGAQSKADPKAKSQTRTDPQIASNAGSKAAQQAADLSRIVGAGNKVSVAVKTTSEAETLISKPKATIVSNGVQANKTAATPQGGTAQTPSASANLGQNAAGDAQQAATRQVRQAQPTPARSLAGGSSPAGPGAGQTGIGAQNAQAGGGEITAPAATDAGAQQSRQTQAPKRQAQPRQATLPKQAVVDQVMVQINKAVGGGVDKISIQLKPDSLGRVEVQLKMGQDGKVSAVVTADKQDTLDLLQRDAKGLEQALKDAGMDLAEENLSFNLRGEENRDADEDQSALDAGLAETKPEDERETTTDSPIAAYTGGVRPDGRIDIRA